MWDKYKSDAQFKAKVDAAVANRRSSRPTVAAVGNTATTAKASSAATTAPISVAASVPDEKVSYKRLFTAHNVYSMSIYFVSFLLYQQKELLQQKKLALAESCLTGPCGRSRLLVTGGGRAGKTSLCRSLQNKDFQQTPSTPGIESTTLEVSIDHIAVREGGGEREEGGKAWSAHERPKKEMEFLLARAVHEKEKELERQKEQREKQRKGQISSADDLSVRQGTASELQSQPPSQSLVGGSKSSSTSSEGDGGGGGGGGASQSKSGVMIPLYQTLLSFNLLHCLIPFSQFYRCFC